MKNGYVTTIILLVSSVMLTSCTSIKRLVHEGYVEQSKVEAQIKELEKKHQEDVAAKTKEVQSKLEKTIQSQDAQLQLGANKLYGANEAFKYYQAPTRLDLIINNRVTEAQAAIGKVPTYEAIQEENKRLKDELDEKKTSLEQLKDANAKAKAEAAKLAEETSKAKKDLEQAKAQWLELEQRYIGDNKGLAAKLGEVNNKLKAALAKAADNEQSIKELKRELMLYCGIAAAIAMIGAIYSPVGKQGLAMIAGILAAVTVAIPFIDAWMIVTGVIVLLAAALLIILRKFYLSDTANTNIIHAIEDTKKVPDATVETLRANLKDWNTKYVKDKSGNIVAKKDEAVSNYIKEKLMETGQLEPDKKA